jgi:flagellar biosynthesis protein FlhG
VKAPAQVRVPFVLVTGGKGGVGKTTIAANLAVALRAKGLRTLLCDLDLALADLHVLLGLSEGRTIEAALRGDCDFADCIQSGPGRIDVLVGSNGSAAMARLDDTTRARLLTDLARLSERYDIVVGDSAAGIGPEVLELGMRADMVLVVTTPDPTAAADAYGLVKALVAEATARGLDLPTPELVLNQVSGARDAELAAARLAGVCQRAPRAFSTPQGTVRRSSLRAAEKVPEAASASASSALRGGSFLPVGGKWLPPVPGQIRLKTGGRHDR